MTDLSSVPTYEAANDVHYRAMVSSAHHQSHVFQVRTPFNHRSLDAINRTAAEIDVVSPTPFAPPVGPYSEYGDIPQTERWGTYRVHYPRFLYAMPKNRFYHYSGRSMQKRIPRYVERTFETPHDVVHTCDIYLDGYGMLPYCRRHDIPLVVTSHASELKNYENFTDEAKAHVRETINYASKVLTVSDELNDIARTLTSPSKIKTVPIGEDPRKFPTDRREQIRYELGIDDDTTLLLFVGAYYEQKGLSDLIEAMKRLDRDDIYLVTVGHEGDMRWWLLDQLGELTHPAHSFWRLDPVALRRWQVAADLLVHPSWTEARPTVIYEAMAAKTPSLATTVGGIPEMVEDGVAGELVPPKDPVTLARAIDRLADDPERLSEMGEAALQRLLDEQWTWQHHARQVTDIHKEVLR
ncbi:glycosyltransferase family 4 protein [Haloarcula pelagica]|uniref:glycosyltransferase family 4 protein n=1 Tax=Haloarcula pelagica TaxID=3033389 RepID=UPI0024C25567|nr:glycosyltransferase family 4 protein [Halomicroarcula sp. YJ-61-S]